MNDLANVEAVCVGTLCEGREGAFGLSTFGALFVILSNVAMIPAAAVAISLREYYVGIYIAISYFMSLLYHMCLAELYCIGSLPLLHILDNYFATSLIPVLAVYLAGFSDVPYSKFTPRHISSQGAGQAILLIEQAIMLAIVIQWIGNTGVIVVWVTVSIFVPLTVKWVWFDGLIGVVASYRWWYLVVGLVFSVGGFVAFFLGENSIYGTVHGVWHILISVAVFFIVISKRLHPRV